jgi:hypothetical protein
MPNRVDPARFTEKTFTRRKTFADSAFADSANDYVAVIDGLKAGRIMRVRRSGSRMAWYWTLTGPH